MVPLPITDSRIDTPVINKLYLRRCKKVIIDVEAAKGKLPDHYIASVNKNLEAFGFCMEEALLDALKDLTLEQLKEVYTLLEHTLTEMIGGSHIHKPMYNNFPREVMEKSHAELYLNAIVHYLTRGKFLPASPKEERKPLIEKTNLTLIKLGSLDDFKSEFTRLISQNSSVSEQSKEDIASYVKIFKDDIYELLPETISNRENKALLIANLLKNTTDYKKYLHKYISTATDILRVAVALSEGDVSLAEPTKFKSVSRSIRKQLLSRLDRQNYPVEDMLRWKKRWIRLGEILHPGEYKDKYSKAYEAFQVLRNDLPANTFNSKVESLIEERSTDELIDLLKTRPGDFARRLDKTIRIAESNKIERILDEFSSVGNKLSTPVLIQVRHHFKTRNNQHDIRVFFPKGDVAKAQAIKNNLPALPEKVCTKITEICETALKVRFSKLPSLGKCYLDPMLLEYKVPFAQRSASRSFRTISRGSKIPLPHKDTLRFFIWWKNIIKDRPVDLDLSAAAFHDDFSFETLIAYHNLKTFGGHHSGDIVDAPYGASEFIDVSMEKFKTKKVRYIAMIVNSYSRQPFCLLPECFVGWMARSHPNSGEIFEAKTVHDKIDLTASSLISIPAIFDIETREMIWADLSLRCHPGFNNNVVGNLFGVQLSIKSIVEMEKPNLFDLLNLHVQARGEKVEKPEDADTIFSVEEDTPFDLVKITSEFMAD